LQFGCAEVGQSKCVVDLMRGEPLIADDGVETITEPLNVVNGREL
jgi:hypothetical protein